MEKKTKSVEVPCDFDTSIKPRYGHNRAHNIVDFSVTTDSVVATATLLTDNNMRRIVVGWGDGATDTHAAVPGSVSLPQPGTTPLPPGTYQFHHAYEVSEDKSPFDHFVLARVEDKDGSIDFRLQKITLTPRYKVTHYRVSVRLPSGCDPFYESENEFDITQSIDGEEVNTWQWNPSNNFFSESQFYRLEGSAMTRELTAADPSVPVAFVFVERDWLFDDGAVAALSLNISGESSLVEFTAGSGDCKVILRYDREVKLIVPLPVVGGGVFSPT